MGPPHDPHRRDHPHDRRDRRRACRSASTATGAATRSTGVGFLDHMLDLLARHGRLDLDVTVTRRPARPAPTTPSRTPGIGSGPGARRGARRPRGDLPLRPRRRADGRGARELRDRHLGPAVLLVFEAAQLPAGVTGGFDHELAEEFFRAVATNARLTLHLTIEAGTNAHHMIEALFKAFARALRGAVALDPTETGVPSTKGTLTA